MATYPLDHLGSWKMRLTIHGRKQTDLRWRLHAHRHHYPSPGAVFVSSLTPLHLRELVLLGPIEDLCMEPASL